MSAKLLRTANFRLALAYALVFSISVSLLGSIIFLIGSHLLEEQLRARIGAEASQLLAGHRNKELEELRHDVKERIEANSAHRLQYSLQDQSVRVVFDRIVLPPSPGWHRLTAPEGQDLLLLTLVLDEKYLMAVAADMGKPSVSAVFR